MLIVVDDPEVTVGEFLPMTSAAVAEYCNGLAQLFIEAEALPENHVLSAQVETGAEIARATHDGSGGMRPFQLTRPSSPDAAGADLAWNLFEIINLLRFHLPRPSPSSDLAEVLFKIASYEFRRLTAAPSCEIVVDSRYLGPLEERPSLEDLAAVHERARDWHPGLSSTELLEIGTRIQQFLRGFRRVARRLHPTSDAGLALAGPCEIVAAVEPCDGAKLVHLGLGRASGLRDRVRIEPRYITNFGAISHPFWRSFEFGFTVLTLEEADNADATRPLATPQEQGERQFETR